MKRNSHWSQLQGVGKGWARREGGGTFHGSWGPPSKPAGSASWFLAVAFLCCFFSCTLCWNKDVTLTPSGGSCLCPGLIPDFSRTFQDSSHSFTRRRVVFCFLFFLFPEKTNWVGRLWSWWKCFPHGNIQVDVSENFLLRKMWCLLG